MSWWDNIETIDVYVDDVIEHIPFEDLEKEYKRRVELKENDPKTFERDERYNHDKIDVEINPEDYDLVKRENIKLNDFDNVDIKFYLENNGYNVFEKGCIDDSATDSIARYLEDMAPYKRKEFLCDILNIGHYSTKEDIMNILKELI